MVAAPHQDGDDALKLLLHQVTDDLVVEILDRLPLQTHTKDYVKEAGCEKKNELIVLKVN